VNNYADDFGRKVAEIVRLVNGSIDKATAHDIAKAATDRWLHSIPEWVIAIDAIKEHCDNR
jgi:hypothetical protein